MNGVYFLLAGLLVLVLAVAGCVGKEQAQAPAGGPSVQPEAPSSSAPGQPASAAGDNFVPVAQGVQIESPLASDNETVDLGSLI